MNFPDVVNFTVGGVGVLLIAALALLAARAGYFRQQLEDLRGDRDDLTKRIERLEKEKVDLAADYEREKTHSASEYAIVVARLDALEKENALLRQLITGKAEHDQIIAMQNHHHDSMTEKYRQLTVAVETYHGDVLTLLQVERGPRDEHA